VLYNNTTRQHNNNQNKKSYFFSFTIVNASDSMVNESILLFAAIIKDPIRAFLAYVSQLMYYMPSLVIDEVSCCIGSLQ